MTKDEEIAIRDSIIKNDLFNMLILSSDIGSFEDILMKLNINSISIYGMGMTGKGLVNLLKNTKISVKCAFDKAVRGKWNGIEIYGVDEVNIEGDAIIVTPTYCYKDIKCELEKITNVPIYNISRLLSEALLYSQIQGHCEG